MTGRAWGLPAGAALLLAGAAAAGGLPVASVSLGAGTAELVPCDGDGVRMAYGLSVDARITTVTVWDIDPACAGGTVRLTLTGGTQVIGAATALLPATGFDGSAKLNISAAPLATAVTRTDVAIDGR
jgi:hypothetical protein